MADTLLVSHSQEIFLPEFSCQALRKMNKKLKLDTQELVRHHTEDDWRCFSLSTAALCSTAAELHYYHSRRTECIGGQGTHDIYTTAVASFKLLQRACQRRL